MSKNIKKKQKEIVDFSISRQIKEGEFWSKDIGKITILQATLGKSRRE